MLTAIPEVDLGIEYVDIVSSYWYWFWFCYLLQNAFTSIKLLNIEETERAKRRLLETKNAPDRDPVIVAAERCEICFSKGSTS